METTLPNLLEEARNNLAAYATFVSYGRYELPRHVRYLTAELEKVEAGKTKRLAINLPPRHSKTWTAEHFVTWFLGRRPDRNVIWVSYNAEIAETSGRRIRNIVNDERHQAVFPACQITADSSAVSRFGLTAGGNFFAVGAQGTLTGRGGDLIICDDLIQNDEAANSTKIKQGLWSWYQATLRTRCEPGARIVCIGTRWAVDDFIGRLLQDSNESWSLISLPAVAEPGLLGKLLGRRDAIGRLPGEPLWSERFDLNVLNQTRATVGPVVWAGLFQQRPVILGGNVFKKDWFQSYTTAPEQCSRVVFSLDCAYKTGQSADFSVITVVSETKNGYYVRLVSKGRWEFPTLQQQVLALAKVWKPNAVLIEDTASGQSLLQTLKAETRLPIIGVKPKGDKLARANAVTAIVESGRVFIPAQAEWRDDFIEELCSFPNGPHDDVVDSMTQALDYLRENYFDSAEWQQIGRQQLAMAAQRQPVADFGGRGPRPHFENVNDMLRWDDGYESDRHTIRVSNRSRFRGF